MNRLVAHSWIYFGLLALLTIAIPTSNFLMSLAQVLLMVNWIAEGQWKDKLRKARRQPLLWAFVAFFFVHLLWCLFSYNWDYALDDLRKKLPLLIVPLVLLTSEPLSRKRIDVLLVIYCCTLLFVSSYSWVNHLINPDIAYRNLFPFISHIRLALNTCMAMFILLYYINKVRGIPTLCGIRKKICILIFVALLVWFVVYLLLLQSYTGFIVLFLALVVVLFFQLKRMGNKLYLTMYFLGLVLVLIVLVLIVGYYANTYYKLMPLSTLPLEETTANGNVYTHHQDGFVECGNYINNYICYTELDDEWNKISNKPLKYITPNGYPIEPTLIRYLNSKGLTKDSVGVTALTAYDVQAIENGKATYYEAYGTIVEQMIYRLMFEYENYKVYGSVKNFSMLQRFELWGNACEIILHNPWLGVGTGDVADEIRNNLIKNNSELKDSNMRTHNQYLTLLLTFGVVGTAIIVTLFVNAIRKEKLFESLLFMAYFLIVMVSFISEDTLETAAGCLFCTFFFALFVMRKQANSSTNNL